MSLKDFFRFPASRLSRRIALWIFFCVILIETLIFIPSYNKREKDLLSQLKDISVARVALIMDIVSPDASDDELFEEIKKLQNDKIVIGGGSVTPDWANEIGAGYAPDAAGAVELCKQLLRK